MQNPLAANARNASESQELSGFLSISRHLRSLMETENAIFSETGDFNIETYVRKKMDLMTRFEQEAQILLKAWGEDVKNPMRLTLLNEIEQVSEVMRQNSLRQLAAIKSRRAHDNAANSAALPALSSEETCH
jgi:hypothetical protein